MPTIVYKHAHNMTKNKKEVQNTRRAYNPMISLGKNSHEINESSICKNIKSKFHVNSKKLIQLYRSLWKEA